MSQLHEKQQSYKASSQMLKIFIFASYTNFNIQLLKYSK